VRRCICAVMSSSARVARVATLFFFFFFTHVVAAANQFMLIVAFQARRCTGAMRAIRGARRKRGARCCEIREIGGAQAGVERARSRVRQAEVGARGAGAKTRCALHGVISSALFTPCVLFMRGRILSYT